MNKHIIHIILLLSLFTEVYTQNYFDIVVPTNRTRVEGIFTPAIELNDTTFNFIRTSYRNKAGESSSICKMVKSGDVISNITLLDSINGLAINDVIKIHDGVLICGQILNVAQKKYSIFYAKLNNLFDTVWIRQISTKHNNPFLFKLINLKDGRFVFIGSDNHIRSTGGTYPDSTNAIIIKTDSLGNILHQTDLPNINNSTIENQEDVIEDSEGNIFSVGAVRYPNLYNNGLIIKLDQNGRIIWSKEISEEGFGIEFSNIFELEDGTLLIIGVHYKPFFEPDVQAWSNIYNISKEGKVIFSTKFDKADIGGQQKCLQVTKENYVCIKTTQTSDSGFIKPLLMKFDRYGNIIWKRRYTRGILDKPEIFFNIAEASDGGYYLTGTNWVDGDNSSKAWIVKVDSNGCVVSGCNTALNIEKEPYSTLFHLFPNPVSDHLSIYLNDEDLQDRSYNLKCFDQYGKIVSTTDFRGRKTNIDLHFLVSGMYFYQITYHYKYIQKGKFIKL